MRQEGHLKVLYIITKSNFGGAQRYVYDLASSLPRATFDVAVASGGNGLLIQKLTQGSIRTIKVPALERDVSAIKDIRALWALVRLFRSEKPDIVHLNSSKAGGLGALAARIAGVQYIIFTAHGWPFWEPRSVFARCALWIFSWLTALLSHAVIVVSEYDARAARKMPFVGKKTTRIYNGIAPMSFDSGDIIRHAFPAGVTIVGTIGELTKNKNHLALIESARNNPHLYVAIVGEGENHAMLEQKIQEYGLEARVKLFGFIPASEVLRGFDRFALPSLKEGLPYVLLEAKQAGLPIDANPVGGVEEILRSENPQDFTLNTMLEKTIALYRNKRGVPSKDSVRSSA